MKHKTSFFLACMAVAIPAQASMHPNAVVDGLAHFMWHMQMTNQALTTGNWSMFWQLFTEQSVCTNVQSMTFIFTPAFFMLTAAMLITGVAMTVFRKLWKIQMPRWNYFRRYAH